MKRFIFPIGLLLFLALWLEAQVPNIRRLPRPTGENGGSSAPVVAPQMQSQDKSPEDYGAPMGPLVFDGTNNPALKFEKAPYDILLMTYAQATGLTPLIAPNVPKADGITIRSQDGVVLTKEEFLQAIETVLRMHNIALIPTGEKFIRVVPANEIRTHGIETHFQEPGKEGYKEDGKMVSQIIQLKAISIDEAKKAIEGFKRGEGQIQLFERTNSILVTDTVENVNRMMEILKYIDIPIENREETHVRPIKFAKAIDIKKRLEEIIADALKDQQQSKTVVEQKQSGSPGAVRREMAPPGVLRPRFGQNAQPQNATPATSPNQIIETLVSDAERGVIRGKVQIVADERTNLLIFITRPENMKFFDKIIDVLDVEVQTNPDVIVEVFRLEHAIAKDVATMLNDLIGNNEKKSQDQSSNPNLNNRRSTSGQGSSTLGAYASRNRENQQNQNTATGQDGKLGELKKENVTILADERSNAVIVMASKADMLSVKAIIDKMDIQLSQVVIETVIVSLTFKDTQETGMDWVQRSMNAWAGKKKGDSDVPTFSFATAGGGGLGKPVVANTLNTTDHAASGINAWFTLPNFNLDLLVKAIQTDSKARVVSSPRITTMDNKEAKLEATERIYWDGGSTTYDSGTTSKNIKDQDIGIKLTVTPRINKKGFITLSITQDIEENEGYESLSTTDSAKYPMLKSRKMTADVAVNSGETVVLGGLAKNMISRTRKKVPILGSIPILGWLFRWDSDENVRSDIIVFLTPRVIDTPAAIEDDARKIKASLDTDGVWDSAWSNSRLADPVSKERAEKIRENGEKTVSPPRYPLTGYLVDVTDSSVTNSATWTKSSDGKGEVPYIHFSDVEGDLREKPDTPEEEPSPVEDVPLGASAID